MVIVIDDDFAMPQLVFVGISTPFTKQLVTACAPTQGISPPATVQGVVSSTAIQRVITFPAVDQVMTLAPQKGIISGQAHQRVIARSCIQCICLAATIQHIVAIRSLLVRQTGRCKQVTRLRIGNGFQPSGRGSRCRQLKTVTIKRQGLALCGQAQGTFVRLQPSRQIKNASTAICINELNALHIPRPIVDGCAPQRNAATRTAIHQQHDLAFLIQSRSQHIGRD